MYQSDAKVLEVRKDGNLFIGDLKFHGNGRVVRVWMAWQTSTRLYKLKANARAAGFEGSIVRI